VEFYLQIYNPVRHFFWGFTQAYASDPRMQCGVCGCNVVYTGAMWCMHCLEVRMFNQIYDIFSSLLSIAHQLDFSAIGRNPLYLIPYADEEKDCKTWLRPKIQ
jgi:hypothetical protein